MKRKSIFVLVMVIAISTMSICGCRGLSAGNEETQAATASSYEIDVEALRVEYYNDLLNENYNSVAILQEMEQYECTGDKEALYKLCVLLNGALYDEEYQAKIIHYYSIFFDTIMADEDFYTMTLKDHKEFAKDYLWAMYNASMKVQSRGFINEIDSIFSDKNDIITVAMMYAQYVINFEISTIEDYQFIIDLFIGYEKDYYDQVNPTNQLVIYSVIASAAEKASNDTLASEYEVKKNILLEEIENNT